MEQVGIRSLAFAVRWGPPALNDKEPALNDRDLVQDRSRR
jgi:hypothetical protein